MGAGTQVELGADRGNLLADLGGLLIELDATVTAGGGGGLGQTVVQGLRKCVTQLVELLDGVVAVDSHAGQSAGSGRNCSGEQFILTVPHVGVRLSTGTSSGNLQP